MEYLILVFFILVIYSMLVMINKSYYAKNKNMPIIFYNPLEIYDYVVITKKECGYIGIWLYIFMISLVGLTSTFFIDLFLST